jgi:8-oxo-dGTP pyrophosphatase MutT (NUDIX family)
MNSELDAISAIYLLKNDGSLLIQLRDNIPTIRRPGCWVIPGGHCELGEDIETCARREFFEETLYNCEDLHFLDSVLDNVEGIQNWLHLFWSRYDGHQQIKCMEGQELKFIDRSEGGAYLKIELLLTYWDKARQCLDMEVKTNKNNRRRA